MKFTKVKKNNVDILIISSCGGHLFEIKEFKKIYEKFNHRYILNDKIKLESDMQNITTFVTHSERDCKILINFYEAFIFLKKYKPQILLSTGAGIIVPFSIIGKLFFNTKTIYIETVASINQPSLTGKIMKYLADDIFYQWKSLNKFFPNGRYIGSII